MKFSEFEYKRANIVEIESRVSRYLQDFKKATSYEKQMVIIKEINKIRIHFESMMSLAMIRHSINTNDLFYEKESDFYDETLPIFENLVSSYYKELIVSQYKKELIKKLGIQIFQLAELQISTISDEVLHDMQKENKLCTAYDKLKANALISFNGKELTLAQMDPYLMSPQREIRKSANEALSHFYLKAEEEFDGIYDELVHLRNEIALKLGFNNFVELAYARMGRTDYTAVDTANYRKQVWEQIVPVATKLRERQAKRLKVDKLYYYDEALHFLSGNANPKGDPQWIVDEGKKMYKELSPETDEFFQFMSEKELMDLEAKKGKIPGGFCEFLGDFKAPFIFSNFNGTSNDIDVLTHEAGHAFQVYCSRNMDLPEYIWPTYEACEIHSMSMEFFTWPWMDKFFKEEGDKYRFSHLSKSLLFIPYGVTVDEFQHWVYENPKASAKMRKSKWREIEKKYLPHRDYEDNDFYERGGFWFRQGHIFTTPFYYIDYTLAQVCAFEFWVKSLKDRDKAWSDYLRLCKAGGSFSFLDLLKLANLKNPFVHGTLEDTVKKVSKWLSQVNDDKM